MKDTPEGVTAGCLDEFRRAGEEQPVPVVPCLSKRGGAEAPPPFDGDVAGFERNLIRRSHYDQITPAALLGWLTFGAAGMNSILRRRPQGPRAQEALSETRKKRNPKKLRKRRMIKASRRKNR